MAIRVGAILTEMQRHLHRICTRFLYVVFMFIGHLPAGYLVARGALGRPSGARRWAWFAVLLGSVFPDFDLFYFYFVDGRQTLHHHYWTHLPFFWLWVGLVGVWFVMPRLFLVAVASHLVLDSIVGGILWCHDSFSMVVVPAKYDFWIWNFVLHWTFFLELLVIVVAGTLLFRDFGRHRVSRLGRR